MMKTTESLLLCACLTCGCAATNPAPSVESPDNSAAVSEAPTAPAASAQKLSTIGDDMLRQSQKSADLMIFESWPQETTLNNAHIADVVPVWIEAIDSAQSTLDFEEYYAINAPGTGLDKVVQALKRAADRGVKIRFIIDSNMTTGDNGVLPQELAQIPNLEIRNISFKEMTGGIQHAKFFIVDGQTLYFGSQNFDWRSLEQISEMGARLRPASIVEPIRQIFETDWKLAENTSAGVQPADCPSPAAVDYHGESASIQIVASPKGYLPCESMWDLPKLIDMIGKAQNSIAIQLLNYATENYDHTMFTELDDALTAAAARGVKVRLLVSDWSTRPKYIKDLKRLEPIDNIETRMIEIPEHSSGFVPYSRTIHSKFMVVDDADSWIGTSNWAGDYFYKSRNIGIIVNSTKLNQELTQSFDNYWNSDYAIVVDPDVNYKPKNQANKE